MQRPLTQTKTLSPPGPLQAATQRLPLALAVFMLLLYVYVLLRTAWLSDDAYITFRTIDNFIHGYGLTWNVAERVQAYTHPLWMLLLTGIYAVIPDPYYTSLILSMLLSVASVLVLALGIARSWPKAFFGLTVLAFSKAFVDYSTSGLENPLTHLLLAVFLLTYLHERSDLRRFGILAVLASLLVLNRLDALLLVAPPLAHAWWRQRGWRATGLFALGMLPVLVWEAFSILYYGFPLPNTAYAKICTDIPNGALLRQGLSYFANSLTLDYVTLPAVAAGLVVAVVTRSGRHLAIAAGIMLYLLYILRIGGDFMSGRFFTPPLVMSLSILCSLERPVPRLWLWLWLSAAAVGLGTVVPYPSLLSDANYGLRRLDRLDADGIADERAFYYRATGLFRGQPNRHLPTHEAPARGALLREHGIRVVSSGTIGFAGFFAGPTVHIVDPLALGDPLLARLPMQQMPTWRPGHYTRRIPDGYMESLESGRNELRDPNLAAYYDHLRLITRGPLLSRRRLAAIWHMNLGHYDHLVDRAAYRRPL